LQVCPLSDVSYSQDKLWDYRKCSKATGVLQAVLYALELPYDVTSWDRRKGVVRLTVVIAKLQKIVPVMTL